MVQYDLCIDQKRHLPRLIREKSFSYNEKVTSARQAAVIVNTCFNAYKMCEEKVYMIGLNSAGDVLGAFIISHGTVDSAFSNIGAACKRALLVGANRVIIAHNHPSGVLNPSSQDDETCESFCKAFKLLDIKLLDFIIVGGDQYSYMSYQENDKM